MKPLLKFISCLLVVAFTVTTALPPSFAQDLQSGNSKLLVTSYALLVTNNNISPTSRFEASQAGDTFPIGSRTVPALVTVVLVVLGLQSVAYGATGANKETPPIVIFGVQVPPWVFLIALIGLYGFFQYCIDKRKTQTEEAILKKNPNVSMRALRGALKHEDVHIRTAAADILVKKERGGDIEHLTKRERAILRRDANISTRVLIRALGHRDNRIADTAKAVLIERGEQAVPELIKALKSPIFGKDYALDSHSLDVLAEISKKINPKAPEAVKIVSGVTRWLNGRYQNVFYDPAPLIFAIQTNDWTYVHDRIQTYDYAHVHAIKILENFAPVASEARPILTSMLQIIDQVEDLGLYDFEHGVKVSMDRYSLGIKEAITKTLGKIPTAPPQKPSTGGSLSFRSLLLPFLGGFGLAALAQSAVYGSTTNAASSGSHWGWGTWTLIGIISLVGIMVVVYAVSTVSNYRLKQAILRKDPKLSTHTLIRALIRYTDDGSIWKFDPSEENSEVTEAATEALARRAVGEDGKAVIAELKEARKNAKDELLIIAINDVFEEIDEKIDEMKKMRLPEPQRSVQQLLDAVDELRTIERRKENPYDDAFYSDHEHRKQEDNVRNIVHRIKKMGKKAVPALIEELKKYHTPQKFIEAAAEALEEMEGLEAVEAISVLETISRTHTGKGGRYAEGAREKIMGNIFDDLITKYRKLLSSRSTPQGLDDPKNTEARRAAISEILKLRCQHKIGLRKWADDIPLWIKESLNTEDTDIQSDMMVLLADALIEQWKFMKEIVPQHQDAYRIPSDFIDENLIQTPVHEFFKSKNPRTRRRAAVLLLAMMPWTMPWAIMHDEGRDEPMKNSPTMIPKKMGAYLNNSALTPDEAKGMLIEEALKLGEDTAEHFEIRNIANEVLKAMPPLVKPPAVPVTKNPSNPARRSG